MMKKFLGNTALILVSILLTYGLMEVFFRFAMPYIPMAFFNNECRELRTIGQTSKQGTTPIPPYIAILGDSYGAGQGDWFADNRYNHNSRYQAAHVVQDITGRDVISLSRAGSGNYDGAAIYSVNTLRYLNKAGFDIPAPEAIVVYFYEGNDISDNLRFLERYYAPEYDEAKLFDDEYFSRFADDMDKRFCQGELPRTQDKFLVGNLLSRAVEGMIYSARKKVKPLPQGTRYNAILDGKEVWLPDTIEADLTGYKPADIRKSVRLFERALKRVGDVWPDSRKIVAYLPSPLSTYAFQDAGAEARLHASKELDKLIEDAARRNGFDFIDFAPEVRNAARTKYLHGPKDWNHFNRAGYELLGTAIAKTLAPTQ
ncbi:SGNH/GDSL hydrolase family protein [uncultured Pseudodesulfovibrio sp.]|uniref:SGNH/GDSL hydrolase family protein n=1 Tax=uncultured Pseudodesulfovibrio sp. TaxID=2035858 RepID=UPI0029C8EB12|nr:SGNH/GDSL hydrolase family protein [uncultured Pseudodesulfovibrio sp.]